MCLSPRSLPWILTEEKKHSIDSRSKKSSLKRLRMIEVTKGQQQSQSTTHGTCGYRTAPAPPHPPSAIALAWAVAGVAWATAAMVWTTAAQWAG
jgi:hypothetical protein